MALIKRAYRPGDLDVLIQIIKEHLQDDVVAHIGPWSRSESMLRATLPKSKNNLIIMEADHQIVAFLWTELSQGHLEIVEIHVIHSFRGQGLGYALLLETEQIARDQGLSGLRLTVFKDSDAVQFYERAGYVRTGENSRNQYRMRKTLGPPS